MMPFWLCASLSGLLFALGLTNLLWRPSRFRAMGAVLMLHGAALLLVAAGAQLGQINGQALALFTLALIPVEYVLGLRLWQRK